jgi:hypothetical protein
MEDTTRLVSPRRFLPAAEASFYGQQTRNTIPCRVWKKMSFLLLFDCGTSRRLRATHLNPVRCQFGFSLPAE